MLSEDRLAAVAALFNDAAIGHAGWGEAVASYAELLDLGHGQLVAFGSESLVMLNIATGEALAELESFGGHSPDINSRVRIGLHARELQFLDESDFTTEQDILANDQYADWMDRHSVGYSCVTPLLRHGGMLVGLAGLRRKHQDALDDEGKRGFMAVAGHIRSAVNLALVLEGQKARSIADAMHALANAVLVYDRRGRLITVSDGAEAFASQGKFGRLAQGTFTPHRADERDRFNRSLEAVLCRRGSADPAPPPMVLTSSDGAKQVIEFVPLPNETGFAFAAAAMVVLRGTQNHSARIASAARELYDLTPAETRLVEHLLNGLSPVAMADALGSSVGTVRNHIHRILSKSGCNSQVEFVTRLNLLCR